MIPATLSFVTLGADDVSVLRRFYSALWPEKMSSPDGEYVAYDLGGVTLTLWPLTNLAREAHADWPGRGGFAMAINLASRDDVAPALEEARKAGAQVWAPEDRDWGGFTGYFADPEGNRWEIAWAPPGEMEDG